MGNITHEKIVSMHALAGRTRRYHTFPVIHQETVGEHVWRVMSLYCQLFGVPRAEVMYYIMHHDSGELSAGDTPYCTKRDVPEIKHFMDRAEERGLQRLGIEMPELTEEEWGKFKLCDLLQMLEFASIEVLMGNQFARAVVDNVLVAVNNYKHSGLPEDTVKGATLAVLSGIPLFGGLGDGHETHGASGAGNGRGHLGAEAQGADVQRELEKARRRRIRDDGAEKGRPT